MATNPNSILLTGGAGYIGSHTCVALIEAGYQPVILDDFSNSHPAVLTRLERITGRPVVCERGNVADTAFVQAVLQRHGVWRPGHGADYRGYSAQPHQPLRPH